MENQTELKWYQKPNGVIILLIFFFPVGLYQMWKNELWTKQTRWFVTGVLALALIANAGKNEKGGSSNNSKDNFSIHQNTSIHRCGRTWNGKPDPAYGQYGDYCCAECYLENYKRDATRYEYDIDAQIKTVYPEYNK